MAREIDANKEVLEDLQKSMNEFMEKRSRMSQRNEDQRIRVTNNFYNSKKNLEELKLNPLDSNLGDDHSNFKVNIESVIHDKNKTTKNQGVLDSDERNW